MIMNNPIPRTAYILQVHKNPEQINKFIKQLISGELADVYVHIDKKNYKLIYEKIIKSPYVKILEKSIDCNWGDISQVDATILLLEEVLASKKKYDFICLRSGQDLLVKNGLKEYLIQYKDRIFLNHSKINDEDLGFMMIKWPEISRKRYTTAHPIRIFRRVLLSLYRHKVNIFPNTKTLPKGYSFYKGSQWFSIPFYVAEYIIDFLKINNEYYDFFKNSLVPDESFFHTIIMNSPYRGNVVNNNLFFMKWGEILSERNSPQDLSFVDTKEIEDSECFFARKFNEEKDKRVISYFSSKVYFDNRMLIKKEEMTDVII